ncbi:unnamed protein product [Mytilus edulis]|uniref:Uncharacterized protein n=1 Tax=Mytilus edulis TaxID=6550 RepID=A0A8S3R2H0_MYTED|nr:unnamed protein product [Mytilus edulis]
MDLSKLKSIRSGNRSAVTKLIRKIDAAKQDTDFDPEELTATFENLLQKQKILNNLNEQILNLAEAEDIESEILDSDEYCITLETKIRHIRNFIQDTHTTSKTRQSETSSQILNVDPQPFVSANLTENSCTQSSQNPFSQASNTVSTNINSKPSTSTELVLHVFTDASPKAYGAAAYLSNENETTLVMAKTRVAPVKCLTLPQLELMAAIIGARLAAHLHSTLNYPKIVFWSDSSIVLHWLTSTKTLKRFIANRVKEITELTHPYKWRYCPTDNNPADLLTRGLTIEQFDQSILWRKGPNWLTDSTKWPELNSAKTPF